MKRFIFSIAVLGVLTAPAFASAATFSFTTDHTSVPIGSPFEVSVVLDTQNEVNAISATIAVPRGLELVNTSNGNSIMNFWVEQPNYNRETRTLTFSGIIPGGFSGRERLITLTLKADVAGAYALSLDPVRTALYQNGPNGTLEPTTITPLTLHAVAGTTSTPPPIADTTPPEEFTPIVTRSPQLYDDAWTLVFATQDKGSGIAQYEVSESPVRVADPNTLSWTKAESPYKLKNQTLARYIYVRAVDQQGNIRTELFTQPHPFSWFVGLGLGILILALVLFIFWRRTKKRFYASS